MIPSTYPEPRDRGEARPPAAVPRYERYETVTATLAAGTGFTLVGQFSGRPDSIDLEADTGPVDVRLTDRLRTEESTYRVPAGVVIPTYISRCVVEARDPAGVGGQVVRAVGKYARRDEHSNSATAPTRYE